MSARFARISNINIRAPTIFSGTFAYIMSKEIAMTRYYEKCSRRDRRVVTEVDGDE